MSCSEIIFTTVGGLRGAISLILVQQVVTESSPGQEDQKVTAEVRLPGFCAWTGYRPRHHVWQQGQKVTAEVRSLG